jgi:hypothetical protein
MIVYHNIIKVKNRGRVKTMRRDEYENKLYQHPSLKAIRTRENSVSKKPLEKGVPRLIGAAMQNAETATAINAFRRVRDYEAKINNLARRRLMKETIPIAEEEALVKKGMEAEKDFRNSLGILYREVRINPDLKAYGEASRGLPVPDEIMDDIQSNLNQDEQEALAYLGWGPEHAIWQEIAEKSRERKAKTMSNDDMTGLLENIEKSAAGIDYSFSPRHLHQQGILTIGGNDWLEDIIVLAIFFFFVLPWLFWSFVNSFESWIINYIRGRIGI